MHELKFIDTDQFEAAKQEHLNVKRNVNDFGTHADYVAEMARQIAVERYSEEAYNQGLRVITTIVKPEQDAAYASLRKGVMDYDRRHGYRGAEKFIDPKEFANNSEEEYEDALSEIPEIDDLPPALVLSANANQVKAYRRGGEMVTLSGDSLKFAARMLDDNAPANKRLRRGAVIRLIAGPDKAQPWLISQQPEVEAAFVAASPIDGGVRALVGGFDFNRNKFNHVTQAWRQPGSSFKPFIYSAALEKGYTAASVIPDEPIVISAEETGSQAWEPKNYDGKYEGPMTLRTALAKSKNMVSIRLLKQIGRLCHPLWLRGRKAPALSDHGLGRRLGHAMAATFRLFYLCQWWLSHPAVYRASDTRRQRQSSGRVQADDCWRRARNRSP
jgi:penicillin-binding protein 1A